MDALADIVTAWTGQAMTRAKVRGLENSDYYAATLPPFRRFAALGQSESLALDALRVQVTEWAKLELVEGRKLPAWSSPPVEITPEAKALVRINNVRLALKKRGAAWGAERHHLPAGLVESVIMEVDALVTRRAIQVRGTRPDPLPNLSPSPATP